MKLMNRMPIKHQILMMALCTITITLVTIFLTYTNFSGVVKRKNNEYTRELVTQVRQSIINHTNRLDRITQMVAYNTIVQEYLMETDLVDRYELYQRVGNLVHNMVQMEEGIVDILLIGENGNRFGSYDKFRYLESHETFPERAKAYYSGYTSLNSANDEHYFVVGTVIYSILPKRHGQKIGSIALIVDSRFLNGGIDEITEVSDTRFYLLDRHNNIYAGSDKDTVGTAFVLLDPATVDRGMNPSDIRINGRRTTVMVDELPGLDGKIVSILFVENLYYDLIEIRQKGMLIFGIVTIILTLLFLYITNRIVTPFKHLITFMAEIKKGDLSKRITLSGYMEINILAKEFNHMLDEVEHLTDQLLSTNSRLLHTELEKKQSEIASLQSQINPHFLYNTLESIRGIAAVKGVHQIRDMAKALGQIFRYSIKGLDTVLLRQELDIVKCYVRIQEIRFEGRFAVNYDIAENTLDCSIPKMILQPLIENAVYHGLEPKVGKGRLTICSGMDEEGCLCLSIRDNGTGITAENLAAIKMKLKQLNSRIMEGQEISVGLFNVNNRIKLIYGDVYGLTIASEPDSFTEVIIKLPCGGELH